MNKIINVPASEEVKETLTSPPTDEEKKGEKLAQFTWRDVVTFGAYFVLMFMMSFAISVIVIIIYTVTHPQATDFTPIYEKLLVPITVWSTFLSGLGNALLIVLFYKPFLIDQWEKFWQNWRRNTILIIIAYLVIWIVDYLFSTFIYGETSANQLAIESMFANATFLDMLLLQISVVLFAPLVEEILCRKILFANFKHNRILGVIMLIVSSVFFGLLHYGFDGILISLIPYMVMGAMLAAIYWYSDNFFTAVGLHFFNNAIAAILLLLLPLFS